MKKKSSAIAPLSVSLLSLTALAADGGVDFATTVQNLGGRTDGPEACQNTTPSDQNGIPVIPEQDWVCRVVLRHVDRDSLEGCFPETSTVFGTAGRTSTNWRTIRGRHWFYARAPMPYAYDFRVGTDGAPKVRVLIHLYSTSDISAERMEAMAKKFKTAASYWTNNSPVPGAHFQVQFVRDAEDAHYSLFLQEEDVRGPAQLRVSEAWNEQTLAHEFGHYLGLDEEYAEFNNEPLYAAGRAPERTSVMASGQATVPYPVHYYWVWRRAYCD
jgi:hypothetical protein